MAGTHQLWAWTPGDTLADGRVEVVGGTSNEGLVDGPARDAWFAQPSGLATSASGDRVWIADSETSALRSLTTTADDELVVETHVGTGLFDFGHRDGDAAEALLQHPLGVTELPDGSVAVSDTYNGAVRRFDPATRQVTTLAQGLAEPSDAVVERDPQTGEMRLVVVESAAHRLTRVGLPDAAQRVDGPAHRTQRPPTPLPAGEVALEVTFVPPAGQKLDFRWGDPTRLDVSATPDALLVSGARPGARDCPARSCCATAIGSGTLHISVQAAACDGDPETGEVPEHAACHLFQQDWGIPVTLDASAGATLTLDLRGVQAGDQRRPTRLGQMPSGRGGRRGTTSSGGGGRSVLSAVCGLLAIVLLPVSLVAFWAVGPADPHRRLRRRAAPRRQPSRRSRRR